MHFTIAFWGRKDPALLNVQGNSISETVFHSFAQQLSEKRFSKREEKDAARFLRRSWFAAKPAKRCITTSAFNLISSSTFYASRIECWWEDLGIIEMQLILDCGERIVDKKIL